MSVTDLQVIDILESTGPTTAGQLADLTGLTTGAITGILNRLEEARLVRRQRDPDDGRRVIVQLAPGEDTMREISPILDSLGKSWDEMASRYDDEQIAFLLEFLKHSNAMSKEEIVRLREAQAGEGGVFSDALGGLERGRLVFFTGSTRMTLRADDSIAELYQARFEGPAPNVKVKDGVITIRYPRYLGLEDWRKRSAAVSLNVAIPWQIVIKGGASEIAAELGGLSLAALEFKGGLSSMRLELPAPSGVVPIWISGDASQVVVRRPAGTAARVHLKGWVSHFVFDDHTFSDVANNERLQSADFDASAPYYNFEVSGSASTVTITSG